MKLRHVGYFIPDMLRMEFFSSCLAETVTRALPQEVDYLLKPDLMKSFVGRFIEMPDLRSPRFDEHPEMV